MGQFYKGTEATFLEDAMFKLPYELMGKVIDKQDAAIDTQIGQFQNQLDLLKADVLNQDTPELKNKIREYQNKIEDAVQGITKDPMNYKKYSPQLNTLKKEIATTWGAQGEVGTMIANKEKVLKEYKTLDDLHKQKPTEYDAGYIISEKRRILEKYSGVKVNTETGEITGSPEIADAYYALDSKGLMDKALKASGYTVVKDSASGGYKYTSTRSGESVDSSTAINSAMAWLQANPTYTQAVDRRNLIGTEGFTGDTKLNTALTTTYAKGKDGRQHLVKADPNMNNFYGRLINDYVTKEVRSTTTQKDEFSTDTAWQYNDAKNEAKKKELSDVLYGVDTEIQGKSSTSASLAKHFSTARGNLATTKSDLSSALGFRGYKTDSPLYKKAMSGDAAAISAIFKDNPDAGNKFINDINSANLEINLSKGAIASFNKKSGQKYSDNMSLWTPKQKQLFDAFQKKEGNSQTKVIKNTASFEGTGTTQAEAKVYQEAVSNGVVSGNLNFTFDKPIPSLRYKGAKVQFYDEKDLSKIGPAGKNVRIVHNGKVSWASKVVPNGAYFIDGKSVIVDVNKDVTVYEGVPNGVVNNTLLANLGHINQPTISTDDTGKGNIYAYSGINADGKLAGIGMRPETIAPVKAGYSQKGKNLAAGSMMFGNYAVPISVDAGTVTTTKIRNYQNSPQEIATNTRNLQLDKYNEGGSVYYKGQVNGINYEYSNGILKKVTATGQETVVNPVEKDNVLNQFRYRNN